MPLYEYECQSCRRHTEKIQKFSDPEITTCPHCGGPLKRVISAPAIAFKGGGWYADGYGNAKPAASGETKGGESKGGDGSSGDSKPDSKVAAATDAGGKSDAGNKAASSESSAPASSPAPAAAPATPANK